MLNQGSSRAAGGARALVKPIEINNRERLEICEIIIMTGAACATPVFARPRCASI